MTVPDYHHIYILEVARHLKPDLSRPSIRNLIDICIPECILDTMLLLEIYFFTCNGDIISCFRSGCDLGPLTRLIYLNLHAHCNCFILFN